MTRDSFEATAEGGADYVLSPTHPKNISPSPTNSSRGVNTELLTPNRNGVHYNDDSKDRDPTISDSSKFDGFIEMGQVGSRPTRTPTPIDDQHAEILIEKSSGCSCFGWFGKRKRIKSLD